MADSAVKSKKPDDTPFKQQRMPSWQPILTPIKVIGIFLVIGIIFIPVGVALINASKNVNKLNFITYLFLLFYFYFITTKKIYENSVTYDGKKVQQSCEIKNTNAERNCTVYCVCLLFLLFFNKQTKELTINFYKMLD